MPSFPNLGLPGDGPAAHEDLTIAETLESMRLQDEHRPGWQCFLDTKGVRHWIADSDVEDFRTRCGAQHPSDYLASGGVDWEEDFLVGRSI